MSSDPGDSGPVTTAPTLDASGPRVLEPEPMPSAIGAQRVLKNLVSLYTDWGKPEKAAAYQARITDAPKKP